MNRANTKTCGVCHLQTEYAERVNAPYKRDMEHMTVIPSRRPERAGRISVGMISVPFPCVRRSVTRMF